MRRRPFHHPFAILAALVLARLAGGEGIAAAADEALPSAPAPSSDATGESTNTQDPQLSLARSFIHRAEQLFAAQHYAAALSEFTRAYELLHGHPKQYFVLHNLAVCNERLFRYDVALRLYEDYLRRAPATEDDREAVAAVTRTLHALLATLEVTTSVPVEVWVDDRRMGTAPGSWLVPAGIHVVELRADLYEAQRREVQFSAGKTQKVTFELRRLSTYAGPSPGYFWAATAMTGAAVVAGTAFGLAALGTRAQGTERAEVSVDSSKQAEATQRLSLAADACFGGAVVFGITSAILYFVTDWSGQEQTATRRTSQRRRAPTLRFGSHGRLGANLRGEF
ncbi:MAG TPA: tetratricopeptide repeat protein [Polyangiaceae bacterium]